MGTSVIRSLIGAATLSLVAAGATSASTVHTLDHKGAAASGGYGTVNITLSPQPGGITGSVLAGGFDMEDTSPGTWGRFVAWCLDIAHYIKDSKYILNNTDPFSDPDDWDLVANGSIPRLQNLFDAAYVAGLEDDKITSTAFQLAAWEALYDTGYQLNSGAFQATAAPAYFSAAQGYLDLANGYTGPQLWNLDFLQSVKVVSGNLAAGTSQNLVKVSPVPVPAAGLLLLTALAGFGFSARRRKG